MSEFGFKDITPASWHDPDPISAMQFVGSSEEALGMVMEHTLHAGVPEDVRAMHAAARGAMTYGYLFCPLYAIAVGELFRAADAATVHRAHALGLSAATFAARITGLEKAGAIKGSQAEKWNAAREVRNAFSHSKIQPILPPGPAIGLLRDVTAAINALFAPASPPRSASLASQ